MKELTRDRVVPIISVSFPWRCQRCGNTTPIIGVRHLNRHCPKCQGAAAKEWLAGREAELLPVPYYHVVFTLPARVADIAYQNKTVIYDLLFKASAETLIPSRPIPSTSAHASASCPSSITGVRRSPTIRTCT